MSGVGRLVYPGLLQLAGFISMNLDRHAEAFADKITADARGEDSERDKHNRFYDEYLAVMDMTAEFYLSTVERIFKRARNRDRNRFHRRRSAWPISARSPRSRSRSSRVPRTTSRPRASAWPRSTC
jgi:polyhydroxyalkanoate depolymerase